MFIVLKGFNAFKTFKSENQLQNQNDIAFHLVVHEILFFKAKTFALQ